MYHGVEKRMEDYDKQGNPKQKHIAELFMEIKGKTNK